MTDARWAPVLYGRTEEVDFRFLALPEDAGDAFRESVLDALRPIFQNIGALRGRRAWCAFTTGTTCVFGAIAYLADLVISQDEQFMTRVGTRDLYAFAGYAAKRGDGTSLPRFDDLDGALVHPLLAFVRKHWDDRSYRMHPDLTAYDVALPRAEESADSMRPFDRARIEFVPSADAPALWRRTNAALRAGDDVAVAMELPSSDSGFAASRYDALSAEDVQTVTFLNRERVRSTPQDDLRRSAPRASAAAHSPWRSPRLERTNLLHISEKVAIAVSGVIGGGVIVFLCINKHWVMATFAIAGGGAWLWSRRQTSDAPSQQPDRARSKSVPNRTVRGFRAAGSHPPARDDDPWD
jgi:hypothetical protein